MFYKLMSQMQEQADEIKKKSDNIICYFCIKTTTKCLSEAKSKKAKNNYPGISDFLCKTGNVNLLPAVIYSLEENYYFLNTFK